MSVRKRRPGPDPPNYKPTKPDSDGVRTASAPARDDATTRQKELAICRALECDPVDVVRLRQLAISRGGLISDELRRKAWPSLLDVSVDDISPKPDEEVLHGHRDYNQVVLDVNRSLKRFPPGMEETIRMDLQDQLVDCIMRVLVAVPELHYYQGYHDIVVTLLLVLGEDKTFVLMEKLSRNHLRDFMDHNMDKTKHILNYLYPIVGLANPKLRDYMEKAEVGTIFSLSWLITWFGHVLSDFKHIVRYYDFFIASHPLMPIYLAAAIVLYREKEILATECEMCFIHSLLSKIPDNLPFERLASDAGDLFIQFPPSEVAHEAEIEAEKCAEARKSMEEAAAAQRRANMEARAKRTALRAYVPSLPPREANILVKLTIGVLTAAFSAVAFTAFHTARDWPWWFS